MPPHYGKFIAYFRVTTDRQGKSGLGLAAQREAVMSYLDGGRWALVDEFTEIESGKRNDRPELVKGRRQAVCRLALAVNWRGVPASDRSTWHGLAPIPAIPGAMILAGLPRSAADMSAARNNRIVRDDFLNQVCAFDARLESILLGDRLKILFQHPTRKQSVHRSIRDRSEGKKSALPARGLWGRRETHGPGVLAATTSFGASTILGRRAVKVDP
jgi:hypothetical protein